MVATVSIGIVISHDAVLDLAALLAQADHALYRAKDNGRNRIEIASIELVLDRAKRGAAEPVRVRQSGGRIRRLRAHRRLVAVNERRDERMGYRPLRGAETVATRLAVTDAAMVSNRSPMRLSAARAFGRVVMKRSSDRILTTHVGSLIRPPALQDFLRAKQAGKPYDRPPTRPACSNPSPTSCTSRPKSAIDVVSDGEFGKSISWSQYVLERLSGFERRPIKPGGNPFTRGVDREQFAEFYAELDAREGVATTVEAVCVGPISYTGQAELARDIANFKAALKGVEGGGGVPAGRGAGKRHSGSQERILQERGGVDPRHRGGDAHRISHDHRCRLRAAARRCARRRHL